MIMVELMDLEAAIQHGLDELADGDALIIRRVDKIGHEVGILRAATFQRSPDKPRGSN